MDTNLGTERTMDLYEYHDESANPGASLDYARGYNDGVWATYWNVNQSDDYERGHADGALVRAVCAVVNGVSE